MHRVYHQFQYYNIIENASFHALFCGTHLNIATCNSILLLLAFRLGVHIFGVYKNDALGMASKQCHHVTINN